MPISNQQIIQKVIRDELDHYVHEMVREAIRGRLQHVTVDHTGRYLEEKDLKRVITEVVKEYLTPERVEQIIKDELKD